MTAATDSSAASRRGFLLGAAALALTLRFVRQDPASAAAELPGFPASGFPASRRIELYRSAYRSWGGGSPRWAGQRDWTVRARGLSHGCSPLTIAPDTDSGAR